MPRAHLSIALALAALLLWSVARAQAQVVFDGSLGPVGELSGDMVIGEEWGSRQGDNLFHSFREFNIATGDSAAFTATLPTQNIIGRVTGGFESLINGPLTSNVPGSSLWLINPSGLVFGEGASVDVDGSFFASTADYLLLDDGGRVDTLLGDGDGTVLTMGHPYRFGFLNPSPASIEVSGANIQAADGSSIGLVGGNMSFTDSNLEVRSGQVDLVAVSSAGEVGLSAGAPDLSGFSQFADISMDRSSIDVSGSGGGDVYLVGGQFVMSNGAEIASRSESTSGGGVNLTVDTFSMSDQSSVDAGNSGDQLGSYISVSASDSVHVSGGSFLGTMTVGNGDAGGISVSAGSEIVITGTDTSGGISSGFDSSTTNRGRGGDQHIQAPLVRVEAGALVWASSESGGRGGRAGDITVVASDSLILDGRVGGRIGSGLYARTVGFGDAGNISVTAGDIQVSDGAYISAQSEVAGDAGSIRIRASGDVVFDGRRSLVGNDPGGLLADSGFGNAGSIDIEARNIEVSDSFVIDASDSGAGSGGSVLINAENLSILDWASINVLSGRSGQAGSVELNIVGRFVMNDDDPVNDFTTVNVSGVEGGSSGTILINASEIEIVSGVLFADNFQSESDSGSITVNATDYLILIDGSIQAASYNSEVTGANIYITTPRLEMFDESQVTTNTFFDERLPFPKGSVAGGSIYVNADQLTLSDSVIEAQNCGCAAGNAGDVFINVTGLFSISGVFGRFGNAGVRSQTYGNEGGGNISITAGQLHLFDQGEITSSSPSDAQELADSGFPGRVPGNAGNIEIQTDQLLMESGSRINTFAKEAAGGNIILDIDESLLMSDASITAEALGVSAGDNGGNILLATPAVTILQRSSLIARANAGNGGNIGIASEVLIPSIDSIVDASSRTGVDGQVIIESPNQQITSVVELDVPSFDVSDLLQTPCQVRVAEGRSSLVVTGKGGIPAGPDGYQTIATDEGQFPGDALINPDAMVNPANLPLAEAQSCALGAGP